MNLFQCYDQHLAAFIYYVYPKSFEGFEQTKTNCKFVFKQPDGVDLYDLKEQFHVPGSVICSDAKGLLECSAAMRKRLFEFRKSMGIR